MAERADRFRSAVTDAKGGLSPGDLVLVDEACRLIDRLDRFDALLAGDMNEWLSIAWPYEDAPARLVVSNVLSESRQTVAELRQVVKQIEGTKAAKPEGPPGEGDGKAAVLSILSRSS